MLPLDDIANIKFGDELKIQVLFEGKPLANADVIAEYVTDSETKIKTDAEGKATIILKNNGLNVLAASHSIETPEDEKTDQQGYLATFSFTLNYHDK